MTWTSGLSTPPPVQEGKHFLNPMMVIEYAHISHAPRAPRNLGTTVKVIRVSQTALHKF